jgi:hypothetical protein
MDWFNANQAYIKTFDQTLCFKNKSFSLNQYDEQDDYPSSIQNVSDYESNELDVLVASIASPDDIEELDHEPCLTTSEYRSDAAVFHINFYRLKPKYNIVSFVLRITVKMYLRKYLYRFFLSCVRAETKILKVFCSGVSFTISGSGLVPCRKGLRAIFISSF